MITKFINSIKPVFLFCFILISVIACEEDFEDVGVSLVDNDVFNTDQIDFEVIGYSKNVDSSRVDGLIGLGGLYNLGVYENENFGVLNASIVAQIGSGSIIDFGLNPVIDTVILDIPYFSTREDDNDDGTPSFTLDSIIGDQDVEYTMNVKRLTTFLNSLDPNDLTRVNEYFSSDTYATSTELHSGLFKPNRNDTVLYVNRDFFEGEESIDTIKKDDLSPSIKLNLDNAEVERIFLTEATESNLVSSNSFVSYFRGILLEATGSDGSLMSLLTSDATVNIYYTNEVLTDEGETDLNGDGDTDDLDVPVLTKQTLVLTLSGIIASTYNRDYAGSTIESFLNAPDITSGQENLFVQGSAGSIAELEVQIDIEELRARNWLINGAILDVYVDEDFPDNTIVPEQLYLYNADFNSLLLDVLSEAGFFSTVGIGGVLERDEDTGEPIRYRFSITDYISELLKPDSTDDIAKLGLKVYHPTEAVIDTIVQDFSWRSKGVVLKANKFPLTDIDNKRLKLTIYYTELN